MGELYLENRATLVWIFECSMVRFRIFYYSCCRGLLLDVGVCDQKGRVSRSARGQMEGDVMHKCASEVGSRRRGRGINVNVG